MIPVVEDLEFTTKPVGASLLAMAVYQAMAVSVQHNIHYRVYFKSAATLSATSLGSHACHTSGCAFMNASAA